jgi:hypothetical protein
MNQRERLLLIILIATMLSVGGGVAGYTLLWKPYWDADARLKKANDDLTNKKKELDTARRKNADLLEANPRLAMWRRLSLPDAPKKETSDKHLEDMLEQYRRYLSDTLTECGFRDPRPNQAGGPLIVPEPADSKSAPELANKTPMYTRFAFKVDAIADYDNVRRALEKLERAPILHTVRKMTLTSRSPQQPDNLSVKMTIEVLMVNGALKRDTLWGTRWWAPPAPVVLAYNPERPARRYADMVAHNMWKGMDQGPPRITEDSKEVLEHVKLTFIMGDQIGERETTVGGAALAVRLFEYEAYLYDQGKTPKKTDRNPRQEPEEMPLPMVRWQPVRMGGFRGGRTNDIARPWWRAPQPLTTDFTITDKYWNEDYPTANRVFVGTVVDVTNQYLFFTEKGQGVIYQMRVGDVLYAAFQQPLRSPAVLAGVGAVYPRTRIAEQDPPKFPIGGQR